MQRQSDNRHHLVVQVRVRRIVCSTCLNCYQAMAFLSKYRNLRGIHDKGVREVEYNFGRIFHQLGKSSVNSFVLRVTNFFALGLYSHAVKHYERVLDLADKAGVSRESDE